MFTLKNISVSTLRYGGIECLRTAAQTLETVGGKPLKEEDTGICSEQICECGFKPDRKNICNYRKRSWIVVDI